MFRTSLGWMGEALIWTRSWSGPGIGLGVVTNLRDGAAVPSLVNCKACMMY